MESYSISRKSLPSENIRLQHNPLSDQHDNRPLHPDSKHLLSSQYGKADNATGIHESHGSSRNLFRSDWWLWEIIFTGVSVASLIAIIGILQAYNGQPLPNWPHFITLNAFLAIMSTIFKASMMVSVAACIGQLKWLWFRRPRRLRDIDTVDQASRGSWGSILLLFRLTSTQLVSIGALITILATAIDPFTQQIVSYPLRLVSTGEGAVTSRAQSYDEGRYNLPVGSGVQDAPSIDTKASFYQGIFASDLQPLRPSCVTENCTFPSFDSLALCSKCENVTSEVKSSYEQGIGGLGHFSGWVLNMTYALPGDVAIDFNAIYGDKSMKDLRYGPAFLSVANISSNFVGIKNPLLSLSTLQFKNVEAAGREGNYIKSPPEAHQCALYFCVQSYDVRIVKGTPSTKVVSSWYNETDPVLPLGDNEMDRIFHRATDQDTVAATAHSTEDFVVNNRTFETALWYFTKTLSGKTFTSLSEVSPDERAPNDVLAAMQNSVDVGVMINNLATSFTNRMRAMSSDKNSQVNGTAFISVPHVRVQWAWLSLPILLMVLSLAFLVATSLITKKSNIPVWKTSTLAVMFHGINDSARQSPERPHMNIELTSQMKSEGERRRVALAPNGNGEWKLQDCT